MNECQYSPQQIIGFLLLIVAVIANVACYYSRLSFLAHASILNVIIIVAIISLLMTSRREDFFFHVSPGKKACLEQQVLPVRVPQRSCLCCQPGYVGGSLPVYQEWITPDRYSGSWKRTENRTRNATDPVLTSQLPPTEYVPPRRKMNRSQVEMYTQKSV